MAEVKYKFNPYKTKKVKNKFSDANLKKEIKSLQKQRDNLDKRLRNEGIDPDTLGGEFDNRNFLEKAFNVKPDQGVLFDFFEVINRPVEAVKAATMAGFDGGGMLEAAWKGLSGQQLTPGGDVLERIGIDFGDSPVMELAEDIAADIIMDPLNLIPSGFFLKKFGRVFTRSKQKVLQQFTGEVLNVVNKIEVDGKLLDFKNLDELDDFLKNKATKDQIKQINKKLQEKIKPPAGAGEWKGDVFAKGTRNADDDYGFINTYEQLKQRAEYLQDLRKKLDDIDVRFKKGLISEAERIKQINKTIPKAFRSGAPKSAKFKNAAGELVDVEYWSKNGIQEQVLVEMNLYDEAQEIASRYGSEYDVILNKTSNRVDDVTIVRKVEVGDETYYIKTLGLEAKDMDGFFLQTATLEVVGGKVVLRQSNRAQSYSQSIQQRWNKLMDRKARGRGQQITVGRKIEIAKNRKIIDPITKKNIAKRNVKLTDLLDAEGQKELKELLIDMYKEASGIAADKPAIIYFGGSNKKGFFMDINDAKEFFDLSSVTAGLSDGQFRFLGNAGLDVTPYARGELNGVERLISEGRLFRLDRVIERAENLTNVNRTARVNIFEYYKDKPGLIGNFSKVGARFINFMKEKFSAFGFLPPELAAAARKLQGESAVQYQTRMLRLAHLRETFKKRFPNLSDAYLSELVESGARIVNGKIRFANRTVTVKDYLRSLIDAAENGRPGLLRKFARGKDQAFLNQLNQIASDMYGEGIYFKIEKMNGVDVLKFQDMTTDELAQLVKALDVDGSEVSKYANDILDYGKYNLRKNSKLRISKEAEDVIKNWRDGDLSFYTEFVSLNDDVQLILAREGGFNNFLNAKGEVTDAYLRHTMTKQAYEYMSKNQPGVLSNFARPGSEFFKKRRYLGSIQEVNEYFRAVYELDMDVFDPSAFRAAEDFFKHAFRNVEQGKLVSLLLRSQDKYGEGLLRVVDNTRAVTKELSDTNVIFKDFRQEFPQLVKNLSNEQLGALQAYLTSYGADVGNKAIVMNKTMHRIIKEAEKAYKGLDDLTLLYDQFLNTWKGLTLITPGFHLRNLFGNMFNSYVAGMETADQLKYTRLSVIELADFDDAVKRIAAGTKYSELPKKLQKAYDNVISFQRQGLIQSHRGVRDLEALKEASELGADGAKGVKKLYNEVIRLNFNIAEKIDDTQRYILYRWALDKTGDANKAAKIVTDSLFDYSALTGFEKDVMKRLFPFYTFMKNNFIFHSKNIIANPKYYARTGRAYKYYLENIAGYGPDDLPDYMTESMWLPIPMMITKNDKEGIAFLKANLPITDFIELVQNPFEKGVQSVTAPVKLMIEIGAGRDMFTGQPIEKFPGQTNVMESGTGVLSGLRNQRGQLSIFQTPLAQKILNDIGGRTALNFGTVGLDLLDTLLGYQGPSSGLSDFLERAGVASVQDIDRLKLTTLYQDLEQLRNLKRIYEQESGNQLPVLPGQ